MDIRVYTDGSCSDNGSPKNKGSYGLVIVDKKDKVLFEHVERVPNTTNNIMEMSAVIKALEVIKLMNYKTCVIYSDSEYCVKGYNSWMHNWAKIGWKNSAGKQVKNKELWERLHTLSKSTKGLTVQWIKGHQNKNTWNDYIDKKIVSLHLKDNIMDTTKVLDPIIIDIPMDDLKEQKILNKKTYSLELHKDYFRYEMDFCSEEVDEDEYEKLVGNTEDEELMKAYGDYKPMTEVCRKLISYSNKGDVSSFDYSKSSEAEEDICVVSIIVRGAERRIILKDEAKAIEIVEALRKWRWS